MMTFPKTVVVRIAELEIDPLHIVHYKSLLAEEIEASVRLEPGVLFLHGVALRENPNRIRMLECYASQEAYEAHIKAPHFLKYKHATAHMVKALTLLETDPVLLVTKSN
jgi:quinol monooxygenase YgiN